MLAFSLPMHFSLLFSLGNDIVRKYLCVVYSAAHCNLNNKNFDISVMYNYYLLEKLISERKQAFVQRICRIYDFSYLKNVLNIQCVLLTGKNMGKSETTGNTGQLCSKQLSIFL